MSETKRLGRGLEALLGPVSREQAEASGALRELPVASVSPNPFQPRTRMDQEPLDELVASMAVAGLLQPVVVRPRNGGYELIAGERRWRAAGRLGWTKIPAVVKDVDDQTLLTLALVENLQRDNLSPMDEAAGYRRLAADFQLPRRRSPAWSAAIGRPWPTFCDSCSSPRRCRPSFMSASCPRVTRGRCSRWPRRRPWSRSPGRPWKRAGRCAKWRRVFEARAGGVERRLPRRHGARAPPADVTADIKRIEDALRKHLGTDVRVTTRRRGRGFLTLSYYSNDDLARLLELILGRPFQG